MRTNILIIGKGVVGEAIGALITDAGYNVFFHDPSKEIFAHFDLYFLFVHITFPLVDKERWIEDVIQYLEKSNTRRFIIDSTIVTGILHDLQKQFDNRLIIYSPIRATEAIMFQHLKRLKKLWAFVYKDPHKGDEAMVSKYFKHVYPSTRQFHDAEALVLGKLMEVSIFGLNIAVIQYLKRLCNKLQIDFDEAYTEYFRESVIGIDYTELERGIPIKWKNRSIFRPDVIEGKCVMQDIELLTTIDQDFIWHWVIDSNERLKSEKKNETKID